MKQNLLKDDLDVTPLSTELLNDINNCGIRDVINKYSEIIPRYELYGYIVNHLSAIIAAKHIKDRVTKRRDM